MERTQKRYKGVCNKCGCEFRTFVTIETDDHGHKSVIPVEYLTNLALSDDGKFLTCNCPVCNRTYIELHEV